MIDDRAVELIHAGVDGELDATGQAELESLLEGSEEARQYHEEMSRLADFLDSLPDREMPGGLHARIMDRTELPARSARRSRFRFDVVPPVLRYGFAAVAGLVIAVAIFESRHELQDPGDVSNMVGTITRGAGGRVLDSLTFHGPGASGEVSLKRRNGAILLDVNLNADEPIEFEVDFAGYGLEFDAFAQTDSDLDAVQYTDHGLSGEGSGELRFVVLLHRTGADSAASGPGIGMEFSSRGKVIHQGWLKPDW